MSNFALVLVLALCASSALPAISISRWFSSSYYDLRVALRRYGHCMGELAPIKNEKLNETEYLTHAMSSFLDQGNFDIEQLANVTALMDSICRTDLENSQYPISLAIDLEKFTGLKPGKAHRCNAIDDALDSMYPVFRRASLNKSEPLDFSVIQFKNATNPNNTYGLVDLINTSWIKSETVLETVCNITNSVKRHVEERLKVSGAQDRSQQQQQQSSGLISALLEMIDNMLEPLLGLQKRLYWEGSNMYEVGYKRVASGVEGLRTGAREALKGTRSRINSIFSSRTNSSSAAGSNSSSTKAPPSQPELLAKPLNNMASGANKPEIDISAEPIRLNRTSSGPMLNRRR